MQNLCFNNGKCSELLLVFRLIQLLHYSLRFDRVSSFSKCQNVENSFFQHVYTHTPRMNNSDSMKIKNLLANPFQLLVLNWKMGHFCDYRTKHISQRLIWIFNFKTNANDNWQVDYYRLCKTELFIFHFKIFHEWKNSSTNSLFYREEHRNRVRHKIAWNRH